MVSWRFILLITSFILLVFMFNSNYEAQGYIMVPYSSTQVDITSSSTLNVGETLTMGTQTVENDGLFMPPVTSGTIDYYAIRPVKGEKINDASIFASHLNVSFVIDKEINPKAFCFNIQGFSTIADLTWNLYENNEELSYLTGGTVEGTVFYYASVKNELYIKVDLTLEASTTYLLTLDLDASSEDAIEWGSSSSGYGSWTRKINEEVEAINSLAWEIMDGYPLGSEIVTSGLTSSSWILPVTMPSGTYDLLAYYSDETGYYDSFDTSSFEVINELSTVTLTMNNLTIEYSDNGLVQVIAKTDAEKPILGLTITLTLSKDGQLLYTYENKQTNAEGIVNWTISANHAPSNYNLRASSNLPTGEEKITTTQLVITKEQAEWTVKGTNASYNNTENGTEFTINATLIDNDGSGVYNAPVTIIRVSDGSPFGSLTTNSQGEIFFSLILTDDVGLYVDYFSFILSTGVTSYYDITPFFGSLNITKATIISSMDPLIASYNTEYEIINVFTTEEKIPLKDLVVTVELLDSSQWVEIDIGFTDENGTISVVYGSYLTIGDHFIRFTVQETANTYGYSIIKTLTVNPVNVNIVMNQNSTINTQVSDPVIVTGHLETPACLSLQGTRVEFWGGKDPIGFEWELLAWVLINENNSFFFSWNYDRGGLYDDWPLILRVPSGENATANDIGFWYVLVPEQTVIIGSNQTAEVGTLFNWSFVVQDDDGDTISGIDIKYSFNGKNETLQTNNNGFVAVEIPLDMVPGNYQIILEVPGNVSYLTSSTSFTLKVVKGPLTLSLEDTFTNENNYATFNISVTDSLNDGVQVFVNLFIETEPDNWVFIDQYPTDTNGLCSILLFISLDQGIYQWKITIEENEIYNIVDSTALLYTQKSLVDLNMPELSGIHGEPLSWTFTLLTTNGTAVENATLKFSIEGLEITKGNTNTLGESTVNLTGLPEGSYDLQIVFEGLDPYVANNWTSTIIISPKEITFSVSTTNITYGEEIIVTVKSFPGISVSVEVDGAVKEGLTNDSGKLELTFTLLPVGEYIIFCEIIELPHGYIMLNQTQEIKLVVSPNQPSINIYTLDAVWSEEMTINGVVIDQFGKYLKVINISIWIGNGVNWTLLGYVNSLSNGSFQLIFNIMEAPDTYIIRSEIGESENYLSTVAETSISVSAKELNLISDNWVEGYTSIYSDVLMLNISLLDGINAFKEGEILISLDVNGSIVYETIKTLEVGKYQIILPLNYGRGAISLTISLTDDPKYFANVLNYQWEHFPAPISLSLQLIFTNETVELIDGGLYSWLKEDPVWLDALLFFQGSRLDISTVSLYITDLGNNQTLKTSSPYFWDLNSGNYSIIINFKGTSQFQEAKICVQITTFNETTEENKSEPFDFTSWLPDVIGSISVTGASFKRRKS